MRMVKAAIGSVLLLGACGSEGPSGSADQDPANVVRGNDFDQAYLSGQLGSVTVAGEATVQIEQYDDGCLDCAYTNVVVRAARSDGSWGMTILDIDGTLADLTTGETNVYVTGCSGPEADVMDWDVPADDVTTDSQPDPDDPSSTIVSIDSTFSGANPQPRERNTWWGSGEETSPGGDGVTTLIRIAR